MKLQFFNFRYGVLQSSSSTDPVKFQSSDQPPIPLSVRRWFRPREKRQADGSISEHFSIKTFLKKSGRKFRKRKP
jgi:hypothetical protein